MAAGGDNGLLKVIGGQSNADSNDKIGITSIGNQTLIGHSGRILRLAWNATYRKLASADEHGLIIVWAFQQKQLVQEMVNASDHAPVGDLKWSHDGKQICIVYGDGTIVVGSVEGTRTWARDLDASLKLVEWSPDDKNILFVTTDDIISVYDSAGNVVKELNGDNGATDIVDLHWHHYSPTDRPDFAIAYSCGVVHISKGLQDGNLSNIDCGITIEACKWNPSGTILAVGGVNEVDPTQPSEVKFYDHHGVFLHCFKISSTERVFDIIWDRRGFKLLVACESCIFFANIQPPTKWTTIGTTLIYSAEVRKSDCPAV